MQLINDQVLHFNRISQYVGEIGAHKMALIYRLEKSMVCGIAKSSIFSL